jgi:hypothetical protein
MAFQNRQCLAVNLDSYSGDVIRLGADGVEQARSMRRESAVFRRPTRLQHMGRVHHVNLAGPFRISPIVGLKNCDTRLQEGMGN